MATASSGLIAALKASLADSAAQWSVIGYAQNEEKETAPVLDGGMNMISIETVVAAINHVVALSSPVVRVAVGSRAPLSIAYTGKTDDVGAYQSSILIIDGVKFDAVDSALHTQIMALVTSASSDIDDDVTASLTLGPQTF